MGIEVFKLGYWALKLLGFPLIAVLYGFNFKQYEHFFDQHIDYVLMLTVGSGIALADAISHFAKTVTLESSIYAILYGILMAGVKSIFGVIFTAITTWAIRIISPYFVKRSEPLKRWLKNKFK